MIVKLSFEFLEATEEDCNYNVGRASEVEQEKELVVPFCRYFILICGELELQLRLIESANLIIDRHLFLAIKPQLPFDNN